MNKANSWLKKNHENSRHIWKLVLNVNVTGGSTLIHPAIYFLSYWCSISLPFLICFSAISKSSILQNQKLLITPSSLPPYVFVSQLQKEIDSLTTSKDYWVLILGSISGMALECKWFRKKKSCIYSCILYSLLLTAIRFSARQY